MSLAAFDSLKTTLLFDKPYFITGLVSYAVGMLTTVLTYRFTGNPMPALLFINPCLLIGAIATATYRKEFKRLLFFDEDRCIEEVQP